MLRDLDPTRHRYRAIVVGVDDYDDEDGAYDIVNDLTTLHFVIARLRMGDVIEFARSLDNTRARWEALRGGVFEGLVYQNDIRAFLSNPVKRIKYVRLCRRGFEEWTYDFVDDQRNVVGLEIDWKSFTAKIPPGNPDLQFQLEQFVLYRPKPQTGKRAGFRRQWFGRLIDAYRGSPTKIIFVRLPRGPIPRPNWLVRKLSSSIREFASRPNVFLLDEHTFDSLETPALFKDAFHLNDDGCTRFSVKLAREVSRLLRQ
jgi:hypothetical protein